jgi:rhodanese-related sulfurtransferase
MSRHRAARAILIICGIAALGAAACRDAAQDRGPQSGPASAAELAERVRTGTAPLVLDVRTRDEYARGHIPGALNIPHNELANRTDELGIGKTDEVIVLCRSGRRAEYAEDLLIEAGFENVRGLTGHMEGWKKMGYPTQ